MSLSIKTECGAAIVRGFFGKDEDGNHDDCAQIVHEELDVGDLEEASEVYDFKPIEDDPGGYFLCYGVQCPACGSMLEWPQRWELSED